MGRGQPLGLGRLLPPGQLGVRLQDDRHAVGVVQQVAANEAAQGGRVVGQRRLERRQRGLESQRGQRVAAVEPGAEGAQQQPQPARRAAGVVLAQLELGRVDHGGNHRRINAVGGQLRQRIQDERFHLLGVAHSHALQPGREGHLPRVGAEAAQHLFAQPAVNERLAQRRGGRVHQAVGQHAEGHDQRRVVVLRQQPVDLDEGPRRGPVAVGAVGLAGLARRVEGRLQSHGAVHRGPLERGQIGVHASQPLLRVVVAVEIEQGVGRVVVGLVEGAELLIGQVGDDRRVAAAVHAIGGVGEEGAAAGAVEQVVGRGVGPLHLVEDDALEGQRAVGRVQLVVPPLLGQLLRRHQRMEDGVGVDIQQVIEVLQVGAGRRVDRLVGVGHGVDERRQRAFDHLEERVLQRVLRRTGQDDVLQDVGQAGGVGRRGAEGDAEDLVLVVVFQRQQFRPRPRVAIEPGAGVQLRHVRLADKLKAMCQSHVLLLEKEAHAKALRG